MPHRSAGAIHLTISWAEYRRPGQVHPQVVGDHEDLPAPLFVSWRRRSIRLSPISLPSQIFQRSLPRLLPVGITDSSWRRWAICTAGSARGEAAAIYVAAAQAGIAAFDPGPYRDRRAILV